MPANKEEINRKTRKGGVQQKKYAITEYNKGNKQCKIKEKAKSRRIIYAEIKPTD